MKQSNNQERRLNISEIFNENTFKNFVFTVNSIFQEAFVFLKGISNKHLLGIWNENKYTWPLSVPQNSKIWLYGIWKEQNLMLWCNVVNNLMLL